MIITNRIYKDKLTNISNKNNKIFKIVKGLYETDSNTPGYLLAGAIYRPSYISFKYALSYYNMIRC